MRWYIMTFEIKCHHLWNLVKHILNEYIVTQIAHISDSFGIKIRAADNIASSHPSYYFGSLDGREIHFALNIITV